MAYSAKWAAVKQYTSMYVHYYLLQFCAIVDQHRGRSTAMAFSACIVFLSSCILFVSYVCSLCNIM